MGISFRKSIKLGSMRINLSKSGAGVSFGVKGFRLGVNPKGTYINVGLKGAYYRKSFKPTRQKSDFRYNDDLIDCTSEENSAITNVQKFNTDIILEAEEVESSDLVKELNEKQKYFSFFNLSIAGSFLTSYLSGSFQVFLWFQILSILAYFYDEMRKSTIIFYELDEDLTEKYENFISNFKSLMSCSKIWYIKSRGDSTLAPKYNAGATAVVERDNTQVSMIQPPFIKTNMESIPVIKCGKNHLYFLPDQIILKSQKEYFSLGYSDINYDDYIVA